jgi:plastocyanin
MGAAVLLAVAALVQAPSAQPPERAASSGRLEGIARISSRLTASKMRVRVSSEPGDLGPPPPPAEDPFANIVLYLEDAPALTAATSAPAGLPAMRQHDERFTPHVLAVPAGSTISFPNDDPIYHNVFSLSRARTFDLGRYPKGETKSLRFDRAGVVQVFCHIHADMSGYILVLPNRYFVTPDSTGRFVLDDIPPGQYLLVAWHDRIKPIVTPLRVTSGQTTTLDLSIPLTEPTRQ